MEHNESSEWIHEEWDRIDAKVDRTAKNLEEVGRKLDALVTDIQFWEMVLELDDETVN